MKTLNVNVAQGTSIHLGRHLAVEKITRPWSFMDFAKYVTPSILSIISITMYMMVDGIFVSRFVGSHGMAAVSIIMPLFSLLLGISIMMSAGGSALIGIELGAKKLEAANKHFSLLGVLLATCAVIVPCVAFAVGFENLARLLGASAVLVPYCVEYLQALILGLSVVSLQLFFEYFIRLDGKPIWALALALTGGIVNITLDYVFIVLWDMGVAGAGYASAAGIFFAVFLGAYYFFFCSENLSFVRPQWSFDFVWRTMVNGSSEMVTECSTGIKIVAFNYVILSYAGEAGVAAMAILMYLYAVFGSFHFGLSMGMQPLLSINYGAQKFCKIQEILKRTALIAGIASLCSGCIAFFFKEEIVDVFAHGQSDVVEYATHGLGVLSIAATLCSINILASGFFTSMGNGKISAFISLCNSFFLTLVFIYVFPKVFGITGVWWVVPSAEICAALLSVTLFLKSRKKYLYPA